MIVHADEVLSAPVTPDSTDGKSIKLNTSFNDMISDQQCEQNDIISLIDNSSDELMQSLLLHESLPYYRISPDYLYSTDSAVSVKCRRRTCKWMYDICDYFEFNREVVAIAIFYVDRYFTLTYSQSVPVTAKRFQLAALTSLFIAIKLHGDMKHHGIERKHNTMKFNISFCASISRNQFSLREIEECEQSMLRTLDWHVNPVVPSRIIDIIINEISLSICDADILTIYNYSKHLAELSVSLPELSIMHKPSVIAFASVVYAIARCHPEPYSTKIRDELEEVSYLYFDHEKDSIENVLSMLPVVCPNLDELLQGSTSTS